MLGLKLSVFALLAVGYLAGGVDSHGMMMDPVNRASRWRIDPSAPKDYNDNGFYCGGFTVQYSTYGGKCGMCGDSYGDPTPRSNENGGTYGQGVIVQKYVAGETATISVKITTNHKGYFTFDLCNLDNSLETEECYAQYPLKLSSGEYKYFLNSTENRMYEAEVVIPSDVSCDHCVVRWTYTAGNNWGMCPDGTGALGCGPQETFRSCADVSISPSTDSLVNEIPQ